MTGTKKPVGRPRKVKEPGNPDCAPATKGFVKCMLRTLIKESSHGHDFEGDTVAATLGAFSIVGIFATGLGFIITMGNPTTSWWSSVLASMFMMFITITIACLLADVRTDRSKINDGDIPWSFNAYTPPGVCAPKKGCE
jgi:hypothetical protein